MPTNTKTKTKRSRTAVRKVAPLVRGVKARRSITPSMVPPPPLPVFPMNMVEPLRVFKASISHVELIIATAFLAAAVMLAIVALAIPLR